MVQLNYSAHAQMSCDFGWTNLWEIPNQRKFYFSFEKPQNQ